MGLRRKSRELALQFLFSHDFQERSGAPEEVGRDFDVFCQAFDVSEQSLPYGRELIQGICRDCDAIDALLAEHSHNWRVERMSHVDRNILRIAVYEMRDCDQAPAQVAINEALEIAKRYSIGESVAFINGILDAVQASLPR
ncbi:transcription antitermination factor NusB [Desulfobulbus sp.]|jgi:N utilization substance protein B|uniref:transcription antitermination factor NusB n=1 Tax=Desulfobulbus sp. TaxID=895 RepID=UPI0027BAA0EE|nr:transcription antitermination factor NusB [Desulfobulbus sp.]MDD2462902.1 transcription antitermination factor NusB [Desulfobulbus sp.]